jgi:hypothetical protein
MNNKKRKQRKYNNQTGCYKIDIFVDGNYWASTDMSKTCKAAKERALETNPQLNGKKITAFFDYQ